MLLKIMENVRRVAVLGSKTAEIISSRVAVLESEAAEVILPRLAVLEPEIAKVIFATAFLVKFRITSPDPSAWSFAENVMSAAEMETESAIAYALRSLEQITPTWQPCPIRTDLSLRMMGQEGRLLSEN